MHWIYFISAIVLLGLATKSSLPGWLVIILLLGALVLIVMWMLRWMESRISSGAHNDAQILSPEELHRLREQAKARRAAVIDSKTDDDLPPP